MQIKTSQIKQLQTVCSGKFRDREERIEFFEDFLGREVDSSKDLSQSEAQDLIDYFNTGKVIDNRSYARFDKNNSRHRNILSICHTIGWVDEETGYADLNRLGGWIRSAKCPVQGKRLMEMTPTEISKKIIPALQNMTVKKYA